jgi:hypothetical protein
MLPLTRQMPAHQQSPRTSSLLDVSDDVLILICGQCHIDELFILRCVSPRLKELIEGYIATIAPSVARSTFPHCDHLLARHDNTYGPPTLHTLKSFISEHLAAIMLNRHTYRTGEFRNYMRSGLLHLVIPSEDPLGDTVRDRVANEWRVLLRLSEISREVCGLGASSKQQEDVILQRRLEYISHMPTKQLHTTQSCIGHSRAHATPQSKTVVLTTKTSYLSSAAAATALGDSREVDYGCAGTYSLKVRACSGSSGGALIPRIRARRITYVTERSRPSRIHPRDWSNIRERWRTRCRVLSIVLRDWRQTRKKICEKSSTVRGGPKARVPDRWAAAAKYFGTCAI